MKKEVGKALDKWKAHCTRFEPEGLDRIAAAHSELALIQVLTPEPKYMDVLIDARMNIRQHVRMWRT